MKGIFFYIIPIALLLRCIGILLFSWEIEYSSGNKMYIEPNVSGFPLPDFGEFDTGKNSNLQPVRYTKRPLFNAIVAGSWNGGSGNGAVNKTLYLVNITFAFFTSYLIYRLFFRYQRLHRRINFKLFLGLLIAIYLVTGWCALVYESGRWSHQYISWPTEWSIAGIHFNFFTETSQ